MEQNFIGRRTISTYKIKPQPTINPPLAFFSVFFYYSSTKLPQTGGKKQRNGKPLCCALFLYSRLKYFLMNYKTKSYKRQNQKK
jgi:hypothetical protein